MKIAVQIFASIILALAVDWAWHKQSANLLIHLGFKSREIAYGKSLKDGVKLLALGGVLIPLNLLIIARPLENGVFQTALFVWMIGAFVLYLCALISHCSR